MNENDPRDMAKARGIGNKPNVALGQLLQEAEALGQPGAKGQPWPAESDPLANADDGGVPASVDPPGEKPNGEHSVIWPITTYPDGEPVEVFMVGFRRLYSTSPYEHEVIEAQANVPFDRKPGETIALLREWVNGMIIARNDEQQSRQEIAELRHRKDLLQSDIDSMKGQWEKMSKFLKALDIDPQTVINKFNRAGIDLDGVPF